MSQPDDSAVKRYASSESDSRAGQGSSSSKKRASRAGTRSVSNLTAAQLERKRANDRDAQRAIRKRTKDHIDTLEQKLSELAMRSDNLQRENIALASRNRDLEEENAYLRGRAGSDAFLLQMPNTGPKAPDSAMGGPSAQVSPELRFSGHEGVRPDSQTPRQSISLAPGATAKRPDPWRQLSQPAIFPPSDSAVANLTRAESGRTLGWRESEDASSSMQAHGPGQVDLHQQRSFSTSSAHDSRPSWRKVPNYGYIVDPNQPPLPYGSTGKSPAFPDAQQPPYGLSIDISAAQQQSSQGYGTHLQTPSSDFQSLSMHGSGASSSTEESTRHTSYEIPVSHIQTTPGYQASHAQQQQETAMQRPPAPYGQQPGPGGYPQPGMEYPGGPPGQAGYPYGQYRGPG